MSEATLSVNLVSDEAFNGFSAIPGQTLHQTPLWARLNPPNGRQSVLHFQVFRGDDVLSQGQIRLRRLALGFSVAAIQRGPVTSAPDDLQVVLPELERELKKRGVVTITINPPWQGETVERASAVMEDMGYQRVPNNLQNFPTATAGLDLSGTSDDLRARMSKSGRKDLRKAENAGVEVRAMASLEEAEFANNVFQQMATATGMVLDNQHDFRLHFDHLTANPDDGVVLVTTLNDEIFGGLVSYLEGPVAYGLNLCTRPDVNVPRTHRMIFEAALALKAKGAERFDLVGYDSDGDAQRLGRSMFKRHFGPDIIDVQPLMSKPLRPVLHGMTQIARTMWRNEKVRRAKKNVSGKGASDA